MSTIIDLHGHTISYGQPLLAEDGFGTVKCHFVETSSSSGSGYDSLYLVAIHNDAIPVDMEGLTLTAEQIEKVKMFTVLRGRLEGDFPFHRFRCYSYKDLKVNTSYIRATNRTTAYSNEELMNILQNEIK